MNAVIFGSSSSLPSEEDYKTAYEIGKLLAKKGITVINGGYYGLMEATSKGAREANGEAIGVTCKLIDFKANKWLNKEIKTKDLFERLKTYYESGDFFIVLNGSTGTLTEFILLWDMITLKMIKEKPIIVFGDYWNPILDFISNNKSKVIKINHAIIKKVNNIEEFEKLIDNL